MKRITNIYKSICSIENLQHADWKARKGKANQYGIKVHDLNKDSNIASLHQMLKNKTYQTSRYTTFKIYEPKEREIYRLPYFPDRITHHAVMNILEPIFIYHKDKINGFEVEQKAIREKREARAADRIKALQNQKKQTPVQKNQTPVQKKNPKNKSKAVKK